MLLDPAPGKRAGALAASLTVQTLAAGTLLLIPLLYTAHLPFTQLQLPTFLRLVPAPPEPLKPAPGKPGRPVARAARLLTMPTRVPPLTTQPEIVASGPPPELTITMGPPVAMPLVSVPHTLPPPPEIHVFETQSATSIVVSSEIQAAKLLRKVVPVYPRTALLARVSGTVRLRGMIGLDGTMQQLQVVSGPALLVQAAVEAVRQWVYRATLLNGKPVEVIPPIEVNFTLSQ